MRAVLHPGKICGHPFQLGGHWAPIAVDCYHSGSGCDAGGAVKETEI